MLKLVLAFPLHPDTTDFVVVAPPHPTLIFCAESADFAFGIRLGYDKVTFIT